VAEDTRVFLVDLSLEHWYRNVGETVDVSMNDVYWHLMGWV